MVVRRVAGRAWGNALGGWRRQGRDARGRFSSSGSKVKGAKNVRKKTTKAQRRAQHLQGKKKKSTAKKVAKVAVATAVVGGVGYGVHRKMNSGIPKMVTMEHNIGRGHTKKVPPKPKAPIAPIDHNASINAAARKARAARAARNANYSPKPIGEIKVAQELSSPSQIRKESAPKPLSVIGETPSQGAHPTMSSQRMVKPGKPFTAMEALRNIAQKDKEARGVANPSPAKGETDSWAEAVAKVTAGAGVAKAAAEGVSAVRDATSGKRRRKDDEKDAPGTKVEGFDERGFRSKIEKESTPFIESPEPDSGRDVYGNTKDRGGEYDGRPDTHLAEAGFDFDEGEVAPEVFEKPKPTSGPKPKGSLHGKPTKVLDASQIPAGDTGMARRVPNSAMGRGGVVGTGIHRDHTGALVDVDGFRLDPVREKQKQNALRQKAIKDYFRMSAENRNKEFEEALALESGAIQEAASAAPPLPLDVRLDNDHLKAYTIPKQPEFSDKQLAYIRENTRAYPKAKGRIKFQSDIPPEVSSKIQQMFREAKSSGNRRVLSGVPHLRYNRDADPYNSAVDDWMKRNPAISDSIPALITSRNRSTLKEASVRGVSVHSYDDVADEYVGSNDPIAAYIRSQRQKDYSNRMATGTPELDFDDPLAFIPQGPMKETVVQLKQWEKPGKRYRKRSDTGNRMIGKARPSTTPWNSGIVTPAPPPKPVPRGKRAKRNG